MLLLLLLLLLLVVVVLGGLLSLLMCVSHPQASRPTTRTHARAIKTNTHHRDGMANYDVAVAGSDVHLRVFSTFTEALTPVPAEIGQLENQLVQFFDSHTVPSKYPTDTQVGCWVVGAAGLVRRRRRGRFD